MPSLKVKMLTVLGILTLASCAPRVAAPSGRLTPDTPTATAAPNPTLAPTEVRPMSTPDSPATGVLRVTATIGPTCPGPQREGQTCTGPYSGEFTLTDRAGNEVARFTTDTDGHAALEVAPGDYRVAPTAAGGRMSPRGTPVEVTVSAGQTVEITIELDSGIR